MFIEENAFENVVCNFHKKKMEFCIHIWHVCGVEMYKLIFSE